MKGFLIGVAVLAVAVSGFMLVVYSGLYNVAANRNETSVVAWTLGEISDHSIRSHARTIPTLDVSRASVPAGAEHYHQLCQGCHGAPGVKPSIVGRGLDPEPPDLSESAREFSVRELYWTIENGIRMTGMPAFGVGLDTQALLDTTVFVSHLPDISPEEYRKMTERTGTSGQPEQGNTTPENP